MNDSLRRTTTTPRAPGAPAADLGSRLRALGRSGVNWGVPLIAIVLFAALAFPFMRHIEDGEWHTCYVRAALRMQAGERIHRVEWSAYAYPPAMALLSIPLANLPPWWSTAAWYLVNMAALCAAFRCAWKLAGGPGLLRLPPRWQVVFWIGGLLAFRFVQAPFGNQQFDVVIAAILFWGAWQVWRGRDLVGAAALGAAAAMKCTPLLFAPYLAYRGKWRAAAVLCAVAVVLNVLPDLFFPQSSGSLYLADWRQSFLGAVGARAPGVWFSDLQLNQSLAGLMNRLAQLVTTGFSATPSGVVELSPTTVVVLRVLTYGSCAVLALATAWRFGSPFRSVPGGAGWPADREAPWALLQPGVEASALVSLMLLISPMSSKAHYIVLLLPCLIFARGLAEKKVRAYRWLLPLLVLLGPLTGKDLTGKVLGEWLLTLGGPTWFALSMLAVAWLAPLERRSPVRAAPDSEAALARAA